MTKDFENEVKNLSNFLKRHRDITEVDLDSHDRSIILNLKTTRNNSIDWNFLQNLIENYFSVNHEYNVRVNYRNHPKPDFSFESDDIVAVFKPSQPVQPIVTYSTDKNDWKLFRFYSQAGKTFDQDYYEPRPDIAEREISNLEDTYSHILSDMKNKVFTRNIIELNINCMNSNDLKDRYIDALRRLPIQLKNRIAISLVRIPKDVSIHVLRQAALICKLCTDNIFLSFPFRNILDKKQLDQIFGVSGFIITVQRGEINNFEDVKKIYDRLNTLFPDKRAFVIFSDEKDYGASYRNSHISRLFERERIGAD